MRPWGVVWITVLALVIVPIGMVAAVRSTHSPARAGKPPHRPTVFRATTTTQPTTESASVGPSPCTGEQLLVTPGESTAGLGHIGVVLLFENRGTVPCELFGYPGVAGLDGDGEQLTQAARSPFGYLGGLSAGENWPEVAIAPGRFASAVLEGTDVPLGTATTCPTYTGLLVTPPNTTQSTRLNLSMPGCSGLQIHPVVPGTSGSSY
jgi:hypothetical protein